MATAAPPPCSMESEAATPTDAAGWVSLQYLVRWRRRNFRETRFGFFGQQRDFREKKRGHRECDAAPSPGAGGAASAGGGTGTGAIPWRPERVRVAWRRLLVPDGSIDRSG
ncbi:Os11g0493900 [Oryza sativa Japonica Group]|uniref:Os11g0493900 protein n=1 Tax=Oryza sativa subsp. japonica TaxID=39947 RepID=A0A0P0Y2M3_ORYSJ|nr:Os11g0493900 [Oryza sativa Japonica Group]